MNATDVQSLLIILTNIQQILTYILYFIVAFFILSAFKCACKLINSIFKWY